MKIFYIILVLAVIYFAYGYIRFKYILSHANLDTIMPQDEVLGAGQPLKYIAVGDSTAFGQGASNVAKTYPHRVAEYLAQKNEVQYRNIAVIGATTGDVLEKQLKSIFDYNPDIVTISIGANDVTHWENRKKIIENYREIVEQLSDKTKAKIYITNVARFDFSYLLPLPFRVYFDWVAKSLNRELTTIEADRIKFIDIHSVAADNSRDQFHPSDTGYGFWTNAFLDKIKIDFP